jgi:hypothetical protein
MTTSENGSVPLGAPIQGLLPVIAVSFTFWGVPADPAHDGEPGYSCNEGHTVTEGYRATNNRSDGPARPFVRNPTSW